MLTGFYLADSVWQIVLLVLGQYTVIALTACSVILFRRGGKLSKQIGTVAVLLLNVILYVVMQLSSRITGTVPLLHLHVPYGLAVLFILFSLVFGCWTALSETRHRKTIHHSSIKEAFDTLPTGVCFFNEAGLPVLCNPAMQRFSFAVCGKDVQYITDLEECFAENYLPAEGVLKDGKVFVLPDTGAWRLEKRLFTQEDGTQYTQFVAADVTDLHKNRVELQKENERLRSVQAELQQLSASIVTVTREEEILNTKMRVHDEMGRCLVAAQKYLQDDNDETIPDDLAVSWQRAVSMIKYSNDAPEEDMMLQIRETCEHLNVAFVQTGRLPLQEDAAYLLICAVRECVTNAVRYAKASELYAEFTESEEEATVTVTNNGERPEKEIEEGGGLSTLRRRVERAGGRMHIQSLPQFKLTVTVPKGKEGVL